jgi:Rrf2 family nitric oxide-sensitive transcriptional repressor
LRIWLAIMSPAAKSRPDSNCLKYSLSSELGRVLDGAMASLYCAAVAALALVKKPHVTQCLTPHPEKSHPECGITSVKCMQLTRFTDLGLRAMMLLAAGESRDERVTTRTIAVAAGASENHIAKAVSRLAELGLVHARRGRAGGLELTEAGRTVSVGWLVRRLEGDREVVDCAGDSPCPLVPACRLRRALADAKEAFYAELDRHTITDLSGGTRLPVILQLTTERNPS